MQTLADLDAVLVLPGSPTPHEDELRALSAELGVDDPVVFPEWLSQEQLEGLYRLAAAFVLLPSLEEGFGLPVLDAMCRGVPVACSNVSSLPEVAGNAALLFDPYRDDAVAGAMRRLVEDRGLAGGCRKGASALPRVLMAADGGGADARHLPPGDRRQRRLLSWDSSR